MLDSTQGFTLIDLLVVIAIIALLISLLLPAMRRDRPREWCMPQKKLWGRLLATVRPRGVGTENGVFCGLLEHSTTLAGIRKEKKSLSSDQLSPITQDALEVNRLLTIFTFFSIFWEKTTIREAIKISYRTSTRNSHVIGANLGTFTTHKHGRAP